MPNIVSKNCETKANLKHFNITAYLFPSQLVFQVEDFKTELKCFFCQTYSATGSKTSIFV